MISICHASDWHGYWYELPPADLYIFTGDMLHNYPIMTGAKYDRSYSFPGAGKIEVANERKKQTQWLEHEKNKGGLRRYLGDPGAPVVLVRGNHDFVDYGEYFGGDYFEVNEDSTRAKTYYGLKIGGFRGIPPIGGNWSDELNQVERLSRVSKLPDDLDIVVSHVPPKGILSCIWGCTEYAWLVNKWLYERKHKPKLCCYGHIHEDGGKFEIHGGIKFVNAACQHVIIRL